MKQSGRIPAGRWTRAPAFLYTALRISERKGYQWLSTHPEPGLKSQALGILGEPILLNVHGSRPKRDIRGPREKTGCVGPRGERPVVEDAGGKEPSVSLREFSVQKLGRKLLRSIPRRSRKRHIDFPRTCRVGRCADGKTILEPRHCVSKQDRLPFAYERQSTRKPSVMETFGNRPNDTLRQPLERLGI